MKYLYYDFEIYPNYWLVVFQNHKGKEIRIDSWDADYSKKLAKLQKRKSEIAFVGFNNQHYDTVMLNYLFNYHYKHSTEKQHKIMYKMSQEIIEDGKYFKQVMSENGVPYETVDIDTQNFLNQGVSLKEIGCRLHHPKLETLPIPPHRNVNTQERNTLREYCSNDVTLTRKIVHQMIGDKLNVIWNVVEYWNLPQEKIGGSLRSMVEEALVDPARKPKKPKKWRYKPPVDFNFKTQKFKDVLETYKGLILEPNKKFNLELDVGKMHITLGVGGAHGDVKKSYFENLIDIDADQYYPSILEAYDTLPPTIKDKSMYSRLIEDKERYGEEGNEGMRSAVKDSINIVFGSMGYEKSRFYAPDKLYQTTITGQLLFLRLIEDMTEAGFEVVYLNTDGITILDNGDDSYKEIADNWAKEFKMKYKEVRYKRAYYRDVNNFILEGEDGSIKRKGQLSTNPDKKASCFGKVATDAVVEHLLHGKNIRDYIHETDDLREFLMYHKYNSNMEVFLETYGNLSRLSNVVRYYISIKRKNAIKHRKKGTDTLANRNYNKNVELVHNFSIIDDKVKVPEDLDKEAYVLMAYDILEKMTGEDVEDNPYIESILSQLGVEVQDSAITS